MFLFRLTISYHLIADFVLFTVYFVNTKTVLTQKHLTSPVNNISAPDFIGRIKCGENESYI